MDQISVLHNWSGGMLCSMGLYLAQKHSNILCLVNLRGATDIPKIVEGVPINILRTLADSLNLPLFTPITTPGEAQNDLQSLLTLVNQKYEVHSVVLNAFEQDTGMQALKKIYEDSSFQTQNLIGNSHPEALFAECLNLGFKAHILSVNEKSLNRSYLGAPITLDMLKTFKEANIHPFGANGEFETICVDGPNFKQKINLNFGDVHSKNGLWYREVSIQ